MSASHRDPTPEHGFPVAGEPLPEFVHADRPPPDDERSVIEMMNGPARPGERTRKTVLWIALAFTAALVALTAGESVINGLGMIEIAAFVVFGAIVYGLIGALRYRGADPMAQFDQPPIPKRRLGRRAKR